MPIHLDARRPRRLFALTATASLILALGACTDDDPDSADDPGDQEVELIGNQFVSTSVEGHDMVPDTTIGLEFTDEALTVSAGCNTMTADWTDDGEVIMWTGPAAATLMGCSDELQAQDQWLDGVFTEGLNIVEGDADLNLEGDDLKIAFDKQ